MMSTEETGLVAYLTSRELEVLALVAVGLSAKEIAKRIAIAPRTVERHIDNARLKMHARNRAHLVTRAIASGLFNSVSQPDVAAEFLPVSFILPSKPSLAF